MTQPRWGAAVRIAWREMGALMTHQQALAESADRRIVLRDGLVVHS